MQNLQLVVETDTDKFKLTAKACAERFKINMIKENSHAQPWWRRTRLHSAKFPICEREKPKKLSAPTKKLQTKVDKCCIGLWDLSQADRQTWQSSCGSVLAIINRHKYKDLQSSFMTSNLVLGQYFLSISLLFLFRMILLKVGDFFFNRGL